MPPVVPSPGPSGKPKFLDHRGGKATGDIGRILGCAERTVKKHLQHIFPKLGVETRTAAAIVYLQGGSSAAGSIAPVPGIGVRTDDAPPHEARPKYDQGPVAGEGSMERRLKPNKL